MKNNTQLLFLFLLIFMAIFSSLKIQAQPATSDENINRDPMIMVPGYTPPAGNKAMAGVITIGDYDNFKLGVDFAECSIANNPRNPLQYYAAWNSGSGSIGGNGYYTNNGFDWSTGNPTWSNMIGDVVVTYDSIGNLAYENMLSNQTAAKVAMSSNNGQTWGSPLSAILGGDKNWIAADQTAGPYSNYLVTTMTSPGLTSGNVSRSTNNGVSWSNTTNLNTQNLPGMSVCIGPEGAIQGGAQYVVTNSGSSFASTYTFYKSTNGGQMFQNRSSAQFANYVGSNVSGRNSVQNMRTRPYPNIAADNSYGPHRGRLYLVYASNSPSGDNHKPDIFCRYSDDGASTWSTPTVVNDDPNSQFNHNWFPAIWCEKETGRLYVSWMDTRESPTSDSALIYASYTDDGINFAPNQRISNKKMKINCTTCGGGQMYQGDYNGVAANTLGSMLAWTDFREGTFGSYVAYFPDFATKVTPQVDTLAPYALYYLKIPGVKLYTDTVFVSATISGTPGLFTVSYPQGNKLWSYPGEVPVQINANGTVPVGDYVVTFIAKGSNGTPVHKRTATIKSIPAIAPLANFSASNINICAGASVNFTDLSSGPPSSWEWTFSGGSPASSNSSNPTNIVYSTPGTYDVSLTVSNPMGNSTEIKTGYITVTALPDTPTTLNQVICEGENVPDLSAVGDNIKWYSNAGLTNLVYQGNSFATGKTLPGIYTYYVTQTPDSCESTGTLVTLSINPKPVVSFNELPSVCANATAFDLTGGEPTGGLYSGNGVVGSGLVFDPQIAGIGLFDLSYIYSDTFGCSDTAFRKITVNSLPEVILTSINPVCANAEAFELTEGSPAGGTYSGNGVSGSIFDPTVAGTGNSAITYSYKDEVTGCENSASTDMTVNILPVVELEIDPVCANTPAFELKGGSPAGGTYSGDGIIGSIFNPSITGTGNFAITYTYRDDVSGCQNSVSSDMVVKPFTAVELGNDQDICANLSILLDLNLSNFQNYLWLPGGQTTSSILVDSIGIGLGSRIFHVFVTDLNNCIAEDSITVKFHDCTGIEESGNEISLNIYPNPTSGIISIIAERIKNTSISIQVFTASDKVVYNEQVKLTGSFYKTIDLQHLADGIYLLKIQDSGNKWTKRFVIRK